MGVFVATGCGRRQHTTSTELSVTMPSQLTGGQPAVGDYPTTSKCLFFKASCSKAKQAQKRWQQLNEKLKDAPIDLPRFPPEEGPTYQSTLFRPPPLRDTR